MPSSLFQYIDPYREKHAVHVEVIDGEPLVPFADIARALCYGDVTHLTPACPPKHVRTVRFQSAQRPAKGIARGGLLLATKKSLSGEGDHFHDWLYFVLLPALDLDHFPPRSEEVARFEVAYLRDAIARFQARLDDAVARSQPAPEPATPPGQGAGYGDGITSEMIDDALGIKR